LVADLKLFAGILDVLYGTKGRVAGFNPAVEEQLQSVHIQP
jgi:hypothetical protein